MCQHARGDRHLQLPSQPPLKSLLKLVGGTLASHNVLRGFTWQGRFPQLSSGNRPTPSFRTQSESARPRAGGTTMKHLEPRRPQACQTPVLSAITLVPRRDAALGRASAAAPSSLAQVEDMRLQGSPAWEVASGDHCQGQSLERTGPGAKLVGRLRRLQADPGYIHSIPGQGGSTNLATATSGEGDYLNG